MATRGRPPKQLDPTSSSAAFLGAELRGRRQAGGWTLQQLAQMIDYSPQHVSEVERATITPTQAFVAAVDGALHAGGALERLLPAVLHERDRARQQRAEARRGLTPPSLRCETPHSEGAGDENVEPTDRRGLLGAGAAAALSIAGGAAAPSAAHEIDPELPEHCNVLLNLLGRHDEMFGPNDVLTVVQHQLSLIAQHRRIARGELRRRLLRVEARWAEFAAWLSADAGQLRNRDAWAGRALRLAQEADYPDMVAFVSRRQSEWATQERDGRRAVRFAETGLRVRGASAQTRLLCARQAAVGYALAGDATASERSLANAYALVDDADSPAPPWAGEFRCTSTSVRHAEARCWLSMRPRKAIALYEGVLREWPRDLTRDRGVHQARLALACAAAGERDRAEAEGRKALAIARATKSATATHELKRLGRVLATR